MGDYGWWMNRWFRICERMVSGWTNVYGWRIFICTGVGVNLKMIGGMDGFESERLAGWANDG